MRIFCFIAIAGVLLAESAAGLHWTAPAGWKSGAAMPMRAATYTVPAAGPGETADCVVYFFGAGQGGGVQANVDRWKGQFSGPINAAIHSRTVHGLAVTTFDASGTYTGMGGPRATAPTSSPGYRLLGAIVENADGNIYIKFAGPAKTIAANQAKFDQLLESFEKSH